MHESNARSVSSVQKGERVKTANFLIRKRLTGRGIFSRPVRRWTSEARQFFRLFPVTGFSTSLSSSVTTF